MGEDLFPETVGVFFKPIPIKCLFIFCLLVGSISASLVCERLGTAQWSFLERLVPDIFQDFACCKCSAQRENSVMLAATMRGRNNDRSSSQQVENNKTTPATTSSSLFNAAASLTAKVQNFFSSSDYGKIGGRDKTDTMSSPTLSGRNSHLFGSGELRIEEQTYNPSAVEELV